MTDHHFRVGQLVTLALNDPSTPVDRRVYKILQLMPEAWGDTHYRIKSISEPTDRIVAEHLINDDTVVTANPIAQDGPRRASSTQVRAHLSIEH